MRFNLTLNTQENNSLLPANYQYPLSAAIYRIIQRGDAAYASFLHDKGYQQAGSLKAFKLFTFSSLKIPFKIEGDRFRLLSDRAELVVCFHLPEAAEHFIKGLFQSQTIEIADKKSRVCFIVEQVQALPSPCPSLKETDTAHCLLHPLSPVVCGLKNDRGYYDFLSPEHPDFVQLLLYNWKEKYKTVYGSESADAVFANAGMEVVFCKKPPKSRLITIKSGTPEETKIRGFVNFGLRVQGTAEALELLLNGGAGLYNSLGMGCIGVVKSIHNVQ
ncbi:CRISPR-associated endoribonuclease Cas6 [Compostibacter hankyongensis]|uniref:CRISPR associated protein Cas6 C-terminal domain-containing protein n=1 Tax=Compostibacter hankyongensis TaxID=1007089 RepID=A0ABP8G5J0_9BACT